MDLAERGPAPGEGGRRRGGGGGPGAPFLPRMTRPPRAEIGNSEAGGRSPAHRGQRPPATPPAPPPLARGVNQAREIHQMTPSAFSRSRSSPPSESHSL